MVDGDVSRKIHHVGDRFARFRFETGQHRARGFGHFCKFIHQSRRSRICSRDELTILKIRGARVLTMFRSSPFIMRIYRHNLKRHGTAALDAGARA